MSEPIITVNNVSFRYGDAIVLDDVTFKINTNTLSALVGPNGSGKSTLIKCITSLLEPQKGFVSFHHSKKNSPTIGYVEQRKAISYHLPISVREIVSSARTITNHRFFYNSKSDNEIVQHAIDSVGLSKYADDRIDQLSGGQQQRVFIAKAFASEPDILILDEPTAGVDSESQKLFRDSLEHIISEHSTTVILVSHELSAVLDLIDHVIVLKHKIVFDGTPTELTARGVSLGVHEHDLPMWLERMEI